MTITVSLQVLQWLIPTKYTAAARDLTGCLTGRDDIGRRMSHLGQQHSYSSLLGVQRDTTTCHTGQRVIHSLFSQRQCVCAEILFIASDLCICSDVLFGELLKNSNVKAHSEEVTFVQYACGVCFGTSELGFVSFFNGQIPYKTKRSFISTTALTIFQCNNLPCGKPGLPWLGSPMSNNFICARVGFSLDWLTDLYVIHPSPVRSGAPSAASRLGG